MSHPESEHPMIRARCTKRLHTPLSGMEPGGITGSSRCPVTVITHLARTCNSLNFSLQKRVLFLLFLSLCLLFLVGGWPRHSWSGWRGNLCEYWLVRWEAPRGLILPIDILAVLLWRKKKVSWFLKFSWFYTVKLDDHSLLILLDSSSLFLNIASNSLPKNNDNDWVIFLTLVPSDCLLAIYLRILYLSFLICKIGDLISGPSFCRMNQCWGPCDCVCVYVCEGKAVS